MEKLTLEKRIAAELKSYCGTVGIYANDFKGNIIEIHADEKYESASTIKTYILADLYQQVQDGTKSLEDMITTSEENLINGSGLLQSLDLGVSLTVKNMATLMIIVSDNTATNAMIDYLGIDHINQTIEKLGLKDTQLHNRIDFEKYPKLGTTTPRDYGKMFELIQENKFVSKEACEGMLEIFSKQNYNSMITRNFPTELRDSEDNEDAPIRVASKSGSMNACRNDGGIVTTPYGSYVISIFHKDFFDSQYHNDHEAYLYGCKVSRLILDQYLALEGKFRL